jgi:hypothetical protein
LDEKGKFAMTWDLATIPWETKSTVKEEKK